MKLARAQVLQADGGWQVLSFLKLTDESGQVGWSEFAEAFLPGVANVVHDVALSLVGRDVGALAPLMNELVARSRPVMGGMAAQAVAAVENALLDLKARRLEVPVCELFGGAVRERIPVYASHVGLYRIRRPELFDGSGLLVPRHMNDMAVLASEVAARGAPALKANLLSFASDGTPRVHMPGFARGPAADPALDASRQLVANAVELVEQLQAGGGAATGVMLDLNFNFRLEGMRRLAAALDPFKLEWLEVDGIEPRALASLRAGISTPIASLEAVYGRQGLLPYLEARSVDVAVIDPMWNGLGESLRMAALAEAFGVNVASHLFSGALATAMSAHFCAAVPNLRYMEVDLDRVAWHDELFRGGLEISDGHARVPEGPGWGVIPDEAAISRHAVTP